MNASPSPVLLFNSYVLNSVSYNFLTFHRPLSPVT
jgi:hypothetical protein